MGRAATGTAFVFVTLTYGSQTVNRTDSLYEKASGLFGNADWGESLTVAACEFPGLNTVVGPIFSVIMKGPSKKALELGVLLIVFVLLIPP